jgi:DNA-binding NarL/FixJ family response regulator
VSITVFLADDHAVVRDGVKLLLETKQDITVVGDADNGRAAVKHIEQLRPDIAILDIAMPEMNGIEATRHIRAACPSVKVIILSMYSTSEHISRALDAGAQGYVLKESAGNELIDAVRAVYAGRFYWSKKIPETVIKASGRRNKTGKTETPLMKLSPREREILQLVVEGSSSVKIGNILHLSPKTVETYRSRLMYKLGITDVPGLVKFAIQHGLTPLK